MVQIYNGAKFQLKVAIDPAFVVSWEFDEYTVGLRHETQPTNYYFTNYELRTTYSWAIALIS
ncbi:MAG: hypothetical protein AB4352_10310 [Hormoscilla sp.]